MENDDCKEKEGDKRGVRLTERKNVRKRGGGPGRVEERKKEEKKVKMKYQRKKGGRWQKMMNRWRDTGSKERRRRLRGKERKEENNVEIFEGLNREKNGRDEKEGVKRSAGWKIRLNPIKDKTRRGEEG